ncbi:MAG: TlpA disulfide reductase family protein [Chloroflexota bacterium]|nr:MAG: thiol:disulfide interchange protein [Chloroflexota bacterium]
MTQESSLIELLDEPQPPVKKRGLGLGSIVLLGAIVVVAAIFGLALARQKQTQPTAGAAPDFTVTTFDGETIRLSDLRGQIVVLNFWASWCGPCEQEAPALEAIWQRYRDQDVVVLGIAYVDNPSNSLQFIERFGLTYPNAPDAGTVISDAYNIQGVPETFIIDRDGNITEFILAQVTEQGLTASLDRLLRAS